MDENGDTIWTKIYSDPRENGIVEIAISQDGGFAFAEAKSVLGMSYQFSILKTDSNGNFLWRTEFGGGGDDYIYGISSCADGGFVVCGSYRNFSDPTRQLYLIKTNELGIISNIRFIADPTKNIKVYPNPFKDRFTLDLNEFPNEDYRIEIFDILGNSVFRDAVNGNSALQIEALEYLPTGTYFLSIKNNYENYIIPIIHN